MFRGIMCTSFIRLKENQNIDDIKSKYKEIYNGTMTSVIEEKMPCAKDVAGTPYCHIGGFEYDGNNMLVIISVIDNLLKGAASQAVENMNIMFGLDHKEGL
jgi:N-acetyl-gamma-glutamyl-phosphate reductase